MYHVSELLRYLIITTAIETALMVVSDQRKIKQSVLSLKLTLEGDKKSLIKNKSCQ